MNNNPYAPPVAAVADIVSHGTDEQASRWSRLLAAILDGLVGAGLIYGLFGCAYVVALIAGVPADDLLAVGLIGMAVGFAIWIYLVIQGLRRTGQTPGKKWVGIRIVRTDGSPASLGRSFGRRMMLNALLGLIPLYGIVDILFIFSASQRCLHDRLADTRVVVA